MELKEGVWYVYDYRVSGWVTGGTDGGASAVVTARQRFQTTMTGS